MSVLHTERICIYDNRAVYEAKRAGRYVYCGRGQRNLGDWGNRYSHLKSSVPGVVHVKTREEAVANHRKEVLDDELLVARIREELKGKVLGCFCPLGVKGGCHADTLVAIANGELG